MFDSCSDKLGPSVIVAIEPIWKTLIEFKKRGVKIRLLTEITKDNTVYCKEFMKITETRHFDGVRINFAILDGKEYQGTIIYEEPEPVSQLIISNIKPFVDQHQYIFDTLWNRVIPAEQKIKEIEEGVRPDFVDIIHDYHEIQSIIVNLIKSAKKEILVIFFTKDSFHQPIDLIRLFEEAVKQRGVKVRVMLPIEDENEIHYIVDALKGQHLIDIQYLRKSFLANVTVFVVDNIYSLTVELKKDNTKEDITATYSNIESTVISYLSMFEILWTERIKSHT